MLCFTFFDIVLLDMYDPNLACEGVLVSALAVSVDDTLDRTVETKRCDGEGKDNLDQVSIRRSDK